MDSSDSGKQGSTQKNLFELVEVVYEYALISQEPILKKCLIMLLTKKELGYTRNKQRRIPLYSLLFTITKPQHHITPNRIQWSQQTKTNS